jgi:hypothetical protein
MQICLTVCKQMAMSSAAGPYIFQSFAAWQPTTEVYPGQSSALALLHQLAADAGIVAIMRSHRWTVGLLAEMPPEGYVGISPVCILGYNTNQGAPVYVNTWPCFMHLIWHYYQRHEILTKANTVLHKPYWDHFMIKWQRLIA